jgi:hypothetical protein
VPLLRSSSVSDLMVARAESASHAHHLNGSDGLASGTGLSLFKALGKRFGRSDDHATAGSGPVGAGGGASGAGGGGLSPGSPRKERDRRDGSLSPIGETLPPVINLIDADLDVGPHRQAVAVQAIYARITAMEATHMATRRHMLLRAGEAAATAAQTGAGAGAGGASSSSPPNSPPFPSKTTTRAAVDASSATSSPHIAGAGETSPIPFELDKKLTKAALDSAADMDPLPPPPPPAPTDAAHAALRGPGALGLHRGSRAAEEEDGAGPQSAGDPSMEPTGPSDAGESANRGRRGPAVPSPDPTPAFSGANNNAMSTFEVAETVARLAVLPSAVVLHIAKFL